MGMEDATASASPIAKEEGEADRRQDAATLRRSRRESAARPEPAKAADAAPQRRSQRSAKPNEVVKESASKKAAKLAVDTVVVDAAPTKSRSRADANPSLSVDTSVGVAPEVGGDGPAGAKNRRPSRRQLDTEPQSVTPGGSRSSAQLILGHFSATDATALCETVWQRLKDNSHKPDVLLHDRSPARIDWQRVADRLADAHGAVHSPILWQRLWKFIAYGSEDATNDEEEDTLMADSEPEDYELPVQEINRRVLARREAQQLEKEDQPPSELAPEIVGDAVLPTETTPTDADTDTNQSATPTDTNPVTPADTAPTRPTQRAAGVPLYPDYDQPVGVPDGWTKPFDLKHTMPLVFVAEKFLKRKSFAAATDGNATTTPTPALAVAAHSVVLSAETVPVKAKRKRKGDEGDGEKAKKPRKKKEAGAVTTPAKAPVAAKPIPAQTVRPAFAPSLTPPPLPTPARPALVFFQQRCKPDQTVPPGTLVDYTALFAQAPAEVRLACEQQAIEDVRRFEREQLRRRLWEKATGNSPAPSPGPRPAGTTSQIGAVPSET